MKKLTNAEMRRALKAKGIVWKRGHYPSNALLIRLYNEHIKKL